MKARALIGLLLLTGCATTRQASWKGSIPPAQETLTQLAKTKQPISVTIIGSAENTVSDLRFSSQGYSLSAWKAAMIQSTQVELEAFFLDRMKGYPNFHVVDRAKTYQVMEELKLSVSGAMSPDVRMKLGQMTGANYLIVFNVTRHPIDDKRFTQETTVRLVSVETGEVLAAQIARNYKERNDERP